MRPQQSYRIRVLALIVLAFLALLAIGCHPTAPSVSSPTTKTTSAPPSSDAPAITASASASPDLGRPFPYMTWTQETNKDPLTLARDVAQIAGGTWIAFADKPLDEIKWPSNNQGMAISSTITSAPTITQVLAEVNRSGSPVCWDADKERALLCFGPQKELDNIKSQPPQTTLGFLVAAPDGAELIRAVEGVWKVKINVAPELLKRRADLIAARKTPKEEGEESIFNSQYTGYRRGMRGGEDTQEADGPNGLQFLLIGRNRSNQILEHLAEYLGGVGRSTGENSWEFALLTDPKIITARIAKLKNVIDERAGAASDAGSSYSSRQAGNAQDPNPRMIFPLDKEAEEAFLGLALLDKAGLHPLVAYLDPERPSLAQSAMRTLSIMGLPEADTALHDFAQRLKGPLTPKGKPWASLLEAELIQVISLRPNATMMPLLQEVACDPKRSPQARHKARMALWKTGDLAAFQKDAGGATLDGSEFQFTLATAAHRTPGATAQADSADLTPLATTNGAQRADGTGESWAVFVSGRLGDSNDLWLAHGTGGKWSEFLFTGQQFQRSQDYGVETPPAMGSCALKVEGDRVTISPPDPKLAAQLAQAKQVMEKIKDPQQQQRQSQAYYQLLQKNAQNINHTITLSLKELRKDSDNDGLSDLVETRLCMDPKTADSNGDGVPDGKDPNPRAPRIATASDRTTLLQMVYTAALGGDPSPDPIIVLLARENWQPFHGAKARTLCMTREEYARLASHLTTLRVLEFGGPSDNSATILHIDGPCLFNDDRTRAEVHFWMWNTEPADPNEMAGNPYGAPTGNRLPSDYVALFEKKSDWKLISLKPWKFGTADRAVSDSIKRMQGQGVTYGGGFRY